MSCEHLCVMTEPWVGVYPAGTWKLSKEDAGCFVGVAWRQASDSESMFSLSLSPLRVSDAVVFDEGALVFGVVSYSGSVN